MKALTSLREARDRTHINQTPYGNYAQIVGKIYVHSCRPFGRYRKTLEDLRNRESTGTIRYENSMKNIT